MLTASAALPPARQRGCQPFGVVGLVRIESPQRSPRLDSFGPVRSCFGELSFNLQLLLARKPARSVQRAASFLAGTLIEAQERPVERESRVNRSVTITGFERFREEILRASGVPRPQMFHALGIESQGIGINGSRSQFGLWEPIAPLRTRRKSVPARATSSSRLSVAPVSLTLPRVSPVAVS